ncbi:cysteine--tRNA ligase [Chitinimonas naiadis]
MALHLYDTYQRALREFVPLHADQVGLYCCGPTVYDYAHIGNLRTYVFEDLLRRTLEWHGHAVRHVVNITDVGHLVSDGDDGEDKMEKGSRRAGESAWVLAERYTQAFIADMQALNLLPPTLWCKATDHIAEQIAFVALLDEKGFVYRTGDGLYFDTSKQDNYGYLARLDRDKLDAGHRVDMGEKRNPTDFALWKFSEPGVQRQMEWDSPWGRGFPGWHIECSAMSAKHLGAWFDIHCGGEDHIAVHHSNEIAQTEAAHGTRLANFWLHGYFLQLDAAKMSKSSGDFLRLQTLADRGIDPLAYRYLCLTAHYRSQLNFTWEALDAAATALARLRESYLRWPEGGEPDADTLARFTDQIDQDLNLPRALAVAWSLVRGDLPDAVKRASWDAMDRVLGLDLAHWQPSEVRVPTDIQALADARQQARQEKRWADADALRQALAEQGWEVEDSANGPLLRPRL